MERLTYFDGGKWRLKIGDTEYSGKAVDRLAAYEDTGLEPEEIWLIGASQRAVRRTLRHILPDTPVRLFPGAEALPVDSRGADTMIFAAGNLAGPGKVLMERVRKEGEQSVL